ATSSDPFKEFIMRHLMAGFCLGLSLVTLPALVRAEPGRWTSGWGQGTSEFFVDDHRGNRLYISCDGYENPGRMWVTLNGRSYGFQERYSFDLIINGQRVESPDNAFSRLGSALFNQAWDLLRQARTIRVLTHDGKEAAFPVKGVAKALPARSSKNYPCARF
ncbi:hypothetical protein, partial [Laribacter hongkongensis]